VSAAAYVPPGRDALASSRSTPTVWLAGGGTVGHLAPAFAVARVLGARGARGAFVTPGEAREAAWFPAGSPPRSTLAAPRRPRGLGEALLFGPRLLASVGQGIRRLHRERPEAVLALGGWPCVPASLAALAAGVPLTLLASDATPGLVVRALAPFARRCYLAQAEATRALGRARTRVTGPVLRAELLEARRDPERLGLERDRLTLFVVGGSLGALGLNRAVAAGLSAAVEAEPALSERLQVLHAVGQAGEGVAEAYARVGLVARVVPFVTDVGTAYRSADLVVSRAGALTCAELEALGVPAVLVPYPHHADRQQFRNAEPLARRGAALLVEEAQLTPEVVRTSVVGLLLDPARRAQMAQAMAREVPDAAGTIAADLLGLRRERA
jgi:UDP-N-acetylglucosamine--N-acetylmuramyl-(pentapeptide) pyrophosphoryl-undecaprenol N-acetylglucosamine transferase